MDNVLGIIAEYNPFHNGHLYHLEKSKKGTNSKYSIAVISGNFTERGIPSIVDKWSKAKMALSEGVDLVLELPVVYSISSAENFADGAINILNSLKIVNKLSFGVECDDKELLNLFADILYEEPKEFKEYLSIELKKGLSFPKARENAMKMYLPGKDISVLSSPNNILAIEYLKALKKYNSSIEINMVKRFGSEHNSLDINEFSSSTAIRNLINSIKNSDDKKLDNVSNISQLSSLIPKNSFSILQEKINSGEYIPSLDNFEKEILYVFRTLSIEEIRALPDVSEGLEYAIKNSSNSCTNLNDFMNSLKSKRYTRNKNPTYFIVWTFTNFRR